MIDFHREVLDNGLRVLVHEDPSSPLATVNVLYDVGARDENPDKTGFAHLFEHLMFGGSANVPNFDAELQRAGGNNNAFTTNDYTNYFDTLPANNIETAMWLEADRMRLLDFSERSLEVQRKVVCEEFKENYINQPYGDVWHKLRDLAFKDHPYRWPTIGLKLEHVEDASLQDVKDFFYRFYRPNNAILSVAGGVKKDEVMRLAEKWFGGIEMGNPNKRNLPRERAQDAARALKVEANVPVDVYYKVWHMCNRRHPDYHVVDMLTDVLSSGDSSRLYRRLVKEERYFSELDAYILGTLDDGLMVVEGKYNPGVDRAAAEAAIENELELVKKESITPEELEKVRNQAESYEAFGNISILNKAMKLAYYELLGDANLINSEVQVYQKVSAADMMRVANDILKPENSCTLHYLSSPKSAANGTK